MTEVSILGKLSLVPFFRPLKKYCVKVISIHQLCGNSVVYAISVNSRHSLMSIALLITNIK